MATKYPECYYPDYLKLDKLLDAQAPLSKNYGEEAHDETLFIIVHQVYELWFKQILHEIKDLLKSFSGEYVPENAVGLGVSRLYRIISIQKVMIDQINIISTMAPHDFLEFRDYLVPASGFQSIQFREIEMRLGLRNSDRVMFDQNSFYERLKKDDRDYLDQVASEESLCDLVDKWLARFPFYEEGEFKYWEEYKKSLHELLKNDEETLNSLPTTASEKEHQEKELLATKETFFRLLDSDAYNEDLKNGKRRLSQKATLTGLFIMLNRSEPLLGLPHKFLEALINIDEHMTTWRYRHALLAHRMLGTKIGTGGSAGHKYLRTTATQYRIFNDLFDLSTFLLPKSMLPDLPDGLKAKLNFSHY